MNVQLTDDDHSQALKNAKALAAPGNRILRMVVDWMRQNNIKCTCAPFETEWQCGY